MDNKSIYLYPYKAAHCYGDANHMLVYCERTKPHFDSAGLHKKQLGEKDASKGVDEPAMLFKLLTPSPLLFVLYFQVKQVSTLHKHVRIHNHRKNFRFVARITH